MQPDRREFLKHLGWLTAAGTGVLSTTSALASEHGGHGPQLGDVQGVLVDLTACVGCRLCEHACKKANGFEPGTVESYDDQSVFEQKRRPAPEALTVVNSWTTPENPEKPVYAKINCMHCNNPACASACIVGALRKKETGAVTYDAWKCIGCRYCMVACPFQLPAYTYDSALSPEVRKCQFCQSRISNNGKPACVEACPRQAMVYGKRAELVTLAHERIEQHPERYVDHIYGEHEVGGTSWMYLSAVPFEQAGFVKVGTAAPPVLTEAIQHGVFKYWIAPVGWYSFLAGMYWWTGRRKKAQTAGEVRGAHIAVATAGSGGQGQEYLPMAPAHHEATGAENSRSAEADPTEYRELTAVAVLDPPESSRETPEHDGEHDGNGHHGHEHRGPAPAARKLLTPGVWFLIALVLTGVGFWIYRMTVGLAASTNLTQQRPWGLWIAMDVGSGIALAGGGFVSAAIFHIFHRDRYHLLARSALLTALLGYTFYVPGLLADLGKWWKLPITMLPPMWQGNSVLFEVGMCVMIYLNVQYAELTPIICERLLGEQRVKRWPLLRRLVQLTHDSLERIMPALLILGVTLSTFHQSSLGNLMNIAPYKLHHLWWGAFSPVHFLLSAMMVGLPMVIFTILFASWCLKRKPEMEALTPLAAHYVPAFIGLYLAAKVGDMVWRGTYHYLGDGSFEGKLWLIEVSLGVVLPLVLFLMPSVRRSPKKLALASLIVILGVVFNRLNVFILAFHPPYETKRYVPSLTEFMVSAGLVAALLLVYRIAVTYLPILEPRQQREQEAA